MPRRLALVLLLLGVILAAVVAMRDRGAASEPVMTPGPRLASLSPAISRTLRDLELDHLLVGRTRYCDAVDASIPVIGDLLEIDYERLIRLRPTHILVQPSQAGVDANLRACAAREGWALHAWSPLNVRTEIEALIGALPGAIFPDGSVAEREATVRAEALIARIRRACLPDQPAAWSGRVLLLYSVSPPRAFGRATYLDDLLVAQGSTNAIDRSGWPELSMEDVVRLEPDAIIVLRTSADASSESVVAPLRSLDLDAARSGRLAVLTDESALLPSSGLAQLAERLRAVLDSFAEPAP